MVGYGGTHSIELLRKPSAEYDHDENTTLRVLWTCTKKTSLMFYRVKLLAKLTLLGMLGGVDNIEIFARDGLQKTILFSALAAEATR